MFTLSIFECKVNLRLVDNQYQEKWEVVLGLGATQWSTEKDESCMIY